MGHDEDYPDEEALEGVDDRGDTYYEEYLEDDARSTNEVGFEVGYEMDELESLEGKRGKETLTKHEEKYEEVEDYFGQDQEEEDL